MSLIDALLLDPQKLDVWIALRTDGVKGSGTESDPYNGSPRYEAAISVSGLAYSGRMATATTAANHGYANGDVVTISGVTGTGATLYDGTYVIYGVTTTTFNYWMKADPGASGAGTMTCARTWFQFDEIRGDPALAYRSNTAIHLGPGVFQTRGVSFTAGGVPVLSGQKILGSGMGVTTVKLVNPAVANAQYWVIGTGAHIEYFELCDLTLDCNLDGQLIANNPFPPIACSGVFVNGSHLRYRRVRVINFGDLNGDFECFVMWAAGPNPDSSESVDCLIEDCILEQPAINQYGQVTVINMGASERGTDGVMAYHRACVVRNCLIDCEFKINPMPITQISVAGGVATVTTALPHGRANGDWVRISGAVIGGSTNNSFNGSYTISNVTSFGFTYTPNPTQTSNPTGEMWLDRFSSQYVAITNLSRSPTAPYTVTVTTATPHFRVKGNNVFVSQAAPASLYNGSFEVTDVPSPTQLTYVPTSDPGAWAPTGFELIGIAFQAISNDAGTAAVVEGNRILNTRIGGPYHDTFTTKDLIVRNNHYRAVVTGPYQALGVVVGFGVSSTSDLIALVSVTSSGTTATATTSHAHGFSVNDLVIIAGATGADANFYNNPVNGLITGITSTTFQYQMTGSPSGAAQGNPGYATADLDVLRQRLLTSLTYALENGVNVATAQTSYAAHGFAVGDAVKISKATGQLDQAHNDLFNGYHTVTAVPDVKTFKYALVDNPNPPNPTGSSPSGYFGRLWQAGRVVIENNVIELIPTPTLYGTPAAIFMGYGSFASPPLFRQLIIRRNVIRHVDNVSDPLNLPQGAGIAVSGCGSLIMEENVLDLNHPTPITFAFCDKTRFFNNTTSSGALIQGVDTSTSAKAQELTTEIEDATLLAL